MVTYKTDRFFYYGCTEASRSKHSGVCQLAKIKQNQSNLNDENLNHTPDVYQPTAVSCYPQAVCFSRPAPSPAILVDIASGTTIYPIVPSPNSSASFLSIPPSSFPKSNYQVLLILLSKYVSVLHFFFPSPVCPSYSHLLPGPLLSTPHWGPISILVNPQPQQSFENTNLTVFLFYQEPSSVSPQFF